MSDGPASSVHMLGMHLQCCKRVIARSTYRVCGRFLDILEKVQKPLCVPFHNLRPVHRRYPLSSINAT